ncbi:MAG: 50S ribosomal protein L9 [Patescibacteria group bacterium]
MKIILLKDIPEIGRKGDIKDVREGFGRNFLLPRCLAKIATPSVVSEISRDAKRREGARAAAADSEKILAERLSQMEVHISMKTGDKDKTFGAVSAIKIAQELKKQKVAIAKEWIDLDKPIKTTGAHAVAVQFPSGAKSAIKVIVEPEA